MIRLLSKIYVMFEGYNAYRKAMIELQRLSDRDLADIGISRCDIKSIAKNACNNKLATV